MREQTYGFFPGGDYDPRDFEPDREFNTPAEIAAWERLCVAWDAGCASVLFQPGIQPSGLIADGSPLGFGTYWIELGE